MAKRRRNRKKRRQTQSEHDKKVKKLAEQRRRESYRRQAEVRSPEYQAKREQKEGAGRSLGHCDTCGRETRNPWDSYCEIHKRKRSSPNLSGEQLALKRREARLRRKAGRQNYSDDT